MPHEFDIPNEIEVSEEVLDIIHYKPHILIRSGALFFLILIILFLAICWMIRFPEKVSAPLRITSENYPKSVTSKIDGRIIALFIEDHKFVQENQNLAFLESTADHATIIQISSWLDSVRYSATPHLSPYLKKILTGKKRSMGELQSDFQVLSSAYLKLSSFQGSGYYAVKKQLLQQELQELRTMNEVLQQQKAIYQASARITEREYSINSRLATEKIIAPLELGREEIKLLEKQIPSKQIESDIINQRLLIVQRRKELLELEGQIQESTENFNQALNTFKSAVDIWCSKYILRAPVSGYAYFSSLIEEQQYVSANQEVLYVGSANPRVYCEIKVKQSNFGKINIGQSVIIKLESYPFTEYGVVEGKIAFISAIAGKDSTYLAKVDLPNGLVTSHGKSLLYQNGLIATAEIITREERLIRRIVYFLRALPD